MFIHKLKTDMAIRITIARTILLICMYAGLQAISCKETSIKQKHANGIANSKTGTLLNKDSIVYKTENLIIRRFSNRLYEHTSFLNTNDFGRVDCNGMMVVNEDEAIIFDTPAGDEASEELITYMNTLKCKTKAVIATHFHEDCVGGLAAFNKYNIPGYASYRTIELLKNKGNRLFNTLKGFDNNLALNVGNKKVYAEYFGEGHTKDNLVGYFPEEKAVFGGCLIKAMDAQKGNLEDANVIAWPGTVSKLKQKYPGIEIVIPGHGKSGGIELLDYTIKLFQ